MSVICLCGAEIDFLKNSELWTDAVHKNMQNCCQKFFKVQIRNICNFLVEFQPRKGTKDKISEII